MNTTCFKINEILNIFYGAFYKFQGYGLDGPGFDSSLGKETFIFYKTGSGAHPTSCSVITGVASPGMKWPGREADHSPPSISEVKNE
jgi:hypothetical protein